MLQEKTPSGYAMDMTLSNWRKRLGDRWTMLQLIQACSDKNTANPLTLHGWRNR